MPDAKIFRVLFTRMGEPSLNTSAVISAARALKKHYPNVRIQVSTIGLGNASARLVSGLAGLQAEFGEQFVELQFSIHSTSDDYRKWLQTRLVSTNQTIMRMIEMYHNKLYNNDVLIKWKVTLNFALTTETPFSIVDLQKQFDAKQVFIKVSPINENVETEKNGIKGVIIQTNSI